MTIDLPSIPATALPVVAWALAGVLLWLWLRRELTPARVLTIVQSEGVLSTRLILGFAVVVYCLFMDAAGRLTNTRLETWLTFAGVLLGLGVAKVVSKAFAAAPPAPPATTVVSKKTNIEADTVTVKDTPAQVE